MFATAHVEPIWDGAQLPHVVVCGAWLACVVALVAFRVAGVAPTVDVAVGAVVVPLVDAGAAAAFAFATVPAIAKNEATLRPANSHRLAAAG